MEETLEEAQAARKALLDSPDLWVFLRYLAALRLVDCRPQVPPQGLSLNDHLLMIEGRKELYARIITFLDDSKDVPLK
jgi:hypothetical protein